VTHLVDKEEKVAIARVKVGLYTSTKGKKLATKIRMKHTFDAERADLIKVIAVYVRVHAEQSSHDGAHGVFERPRERHTYDPSSAAQKKLGSREDAPIAFGKTDSSSRIFWAQFMRASTYSGAGSFVGRL